MLAAGCSSSLPAPDNKRLAAAEKAKDELSAKLKAMTPDERSKYMKEHGQEISKIIFSAPVTERPNPEGSRGH